MRRVCKRALTVSVLFLFLFIISGTAFAATLIAQPEITVSTAGKYPVIKWKPIKNVASYIVYRLDKNTNTYKKIAKTKLTAYTDVKVKSGSVQKYVVIAKDTKGRESAKSLEKTTVAEVKNFSAILLDDKIKLIWDKAKNAEEYIVEQAVGDESGYMEIKTLKDTNYIVGGLHAGETYKFRVRAKSVVNGENFYGEYSSIATVLVELKGVVIELPDGSLKYNIPDKAPEYNYYDKAFSSSHEFRDIFLKQYGADKAVVYDMLAGIMIEMLYNDAVVYGKEIKICGFEHIADLDVLMSASLAVDYDMPFLSGMVFFRYGGRKYDYECWMTRKVINYFYDKAPNDNESYADTREKVIQELHRYQTAVIGAGDDVERLEIAGRLFDEGAVYDLKAPYHAVYALLMKTGICGSSNMAFTWIANAVGVPAFWLPVPYMNHAVTLVKPNSGKLRIIDVTFGIVKPKVENISEWCNNNLVDWNGDFLNFSIEPFYPDINLLEQLGGLS